MLPPELANVDELLKRFDRAKKRRNGSWFEHMQEAYAYAAPQREIFFDYHEGQKKNTDLYDNTAVTGLQTFANRMQKAVVPPWQQWARIVPGSDVPESDHETSVSFQGEDMPLTAALDKVTDIAFDYIHRSNFASRVYETFVDFGISTGVLTCEFDATSDNLMFNAIPLAQVYLALGPNGTIADHWREHEVEGGLIERMWPGAKLPEDVTQKIAKDPGEKFNVVEGCLYHKNEYHYVVILSKSKDIIYEQHEGESGPFISYRGMVVPGEVYGRGPVMQVLPDIKTLNVVKEFELTSAAIAASGAWTGRDDGVFNPYTVQVAPGIVIPVNSNETGNPTLAALPMSFDFEFTQIVGEDLRQSINKALFAEPLGNLDDPTKTATEMQLRYQMHMEDAGAFFARLQTELVEQTLRRVIFLLQREGIIPRIKLDGKDVTLKHTSPIARVMDQEDLINLQRAVATVSMFGDEAVMLTFDTEEAGEYIAKKQGVDPELIRTPEERKALQEQLAQAAEAAMEAGVGG